MLNPPFNHFQAIALSDTIDIPKVAPERYPDGVYVGATGNITFLNTTGTSVLMKAAIAGTILPISPKRVMATGTTATDLVACYRI
ncbi:MAG: hypothetical protein NUW22_07540 [Acidobacteria bacterium]|nr:hypothetical protein [Acidobacteriota bacterium]